MKYIIFIYLLIILLILPGCSPIQPPEPSVIHTEVSVPTIPPSIQTPLATVPLDKPVSSNTPIPVVSTQFAPQPGDAKLVKGVVFLEEAGILAAESFPVQYFLSISGNLPTPCHELRVTLGEPDASNVIKAEVYSVTSPDILCTQVLKPFTQSIPLGSSFSPGQYKLDINGEIEVSFTVQ